MRRGYLAIVLCTLGVLLTYARPEARNTKDDRRTFDSASLREFFEGSTGKRDAWKSAPALTIVTSVMDYASGDLASGFVASGETLTEAERAQLKVDLSRAFEDLTGGVFSEFSAIDFESASPGQRVKVVRAGRIVVGRFRGVQAKTGNLGYGGRAARNGVISGAAVILDAEFDRTSDRRHLLRTHELGHALGYHHVQSQPSVMNPRVGSSLTDFDRAAIRLGALKVTSLF